MTTRDTPWQAGRPAWIDLNSADLHSTRQTYGHLLGWDTDDGTSDSSGYVVALKNGRAAAGLYEDDGDTPSAWLLYLATEDLNATVTRATESGATVLIEPPESPSPVGRFAVLQDPTGAQFGLWEGGELNGMQTVQEPGTYCWSTLLTRDLPAAREFYAAVFGYTYDAVDDGLVTVRAADGADVASMHDAGELPQDAPPAWNVHFGVASRDATVSLAEMEDGLEVLMSFDTPFGPEAVLRTGTGEVFNITQIPD